MPISPTPDIADSAPDGPELTDYDRKYIATYARLLDAEADGADWREVARIVLGLDSDALPDRARRVFDTHMVRAKWIAGQGYRHLLKGGPER
jgi:hypothetical protein